MILQARSAEKGEDGLGRSLGLVRAGLLMRLDCDGRVVETLSLWVDIQQVHILATSELKSNIVNFIAQHTEDAAHRDQLLIIASKLNVSNPLDFFH